MSKQFKIENGKVYSQDIKPQEIGKCFFCGEPVLASEGQAIKHIIKNGEEKPTHKKCRKVYRRAKNRRQNLQINR